MRRFTLLLFFPLMVIQMGSLAVAGGEKYNKTPEKGEKKESFLLVVPAPGGKEVKVADWRFTQGTKHFTYSVADKPLAKGKGPEYLEFRELKSTTYKNGIFTLIPLTSVKKITYDREKKSVAVSALADTEEVTLTGSTQFTTSNRLTLQAEARIEGLEGAATVTYQGGPDKGVQSITFPTPKAADKVQGVTATVTADDKEKSKHTAHDIQPLYLVDGTYRVLPIIHFKKTIKIDLDKVASIRFLPSENKKVLSNDYEVTLKDGAKHTLSLLTTIEVEKKKITFVGLIGRVPVGYKLFSVDAIYEYRTGEDEKK